MAHLQAVLTKGTHMPGPLDGIRIIDLTTMASGPLATSILADQGADVIKVEAPGRGDGLRNIGPSRGGLSAIFSSFNRNKRSIVVDLRDPRGVTLLDDLVAGADVFVQNFRPGAVERMGLGAERYRALHPKLIYVSISGFGEKGPMAQSAVYDSVMQAYSGVAMHQADLETGEPTFVRSVVCDKGTAIQTSQLITAALLARERGAGGQHVRVSMLHASLAFLWPDGMQNYALLGEGVSAPLLKSALPVIRPTKDGYIAISYIQDREFKAFCKTIGREDLAGDARFTTADPRARHARQLQGLLVDTLRKYTTSELASLLAEADVPHATVGDPATIHEDPQVVANSLIFEMDHPIAGRLRQPRPLGDFEATPAEMRSGAPGLGEHTREVAKEIGLTDSAISNLTRAGVLVDRSETETH
jgi:crotonobetainyl-CoA:carnitine CoA-transferase CaiB-like acyl-CoA transferase